MKFKRLLFRGLYYPSMTILKVLNMLSMDMYMKYLTKFLKSCGLRIVGKPNYISSDVYFDNFHRITLNDDCVISKQVVFLTHDYSITVAMKAINIPPKEDISIDGDIVVGKNVFIGLRSTILPGTVIGDNTVIGASSLVKGKIPSNVVVAGNPARVIMSIQDYYNKNQNRIQI